VQLRLPGQVRVRSILRDNLTRSRRRVKAWDFDSFWTAIEHISMRRALPEVVCPL